MPTPHLAAVQKMGDDESTSQFTSKLPGSMVYKIFVDGCSVSLSFLSVIKLEIQIFKGAIFVHIGSTKCILVLFLGHFSMRG